MILDTLTALGLPPLASRLLLVAVALLILLVFRRLLNRIILPRLNRLLERLNPGLANALESLIDMPLQLLFWALGITLVASILWDAPPEFAMHLTRTLIIVAVFAALYNLINLFTRTSANLANLAGLHMDEKLLPFIRTGLRIVVVALGAIVILQEWNFDVGGLIAGLGVSGLAVALAAEDTIANLFGFTTIVGDRPLAVGDTITTPDVAGTVEQVGIRSTRVRQPDRALVTIPNKTLAGSVVTNWSRLSDRRLDMTLGLAYGATSAQLRSFLTRVADLLKKREAVDPATVSVLFVSFAKDSLDMRLIAYVKRADWTAYMLEQQEIMLQIMDLMEEIGLSFAFPGRPVLHEQTPGSKPATLIPPDGDTAR